MKKIFFFFFLFFSLFAEAADIDSAKVATLITNGSKAFCHILDINADAIYQNKKEKMQFVIEVPSNYIKVETQGANALTGTLEQAVKDSANAQIRRIYLEYGVELYVIVINSLDVVIKDTIKGAFTTQNFFHTKLFDSLTNVTELKNLHTSITNRIIEQSLSGQDRDCLILSEASYCGAFFPGKNKLCLELEVVSTHHGAAVTYPELGKLKEYLFTRMQQQYATTVTNTNFSLPATVGEFKEAVKFIKLRQSIQQTFDPGGLDNIFAQFNEQIDYANLSTEDRVHALSVYSGSPMMGDWFGTTGQETHAIHIIEYTPPDKVHDLLYYLEQPNTLKGNPLYHGDQSDDALIKKLIDRTDDAAMSADNNYTKLVMVFTKLITKSEQLFTDHLPDDDSGWQNRQISWNDPQLLPPIGTMNYDISFESNGKVTVTRKIVDHWIKTGYNAQSGENTYRESWVTDQTFELHPFDLVFFTNTSSVGMLEVAGAVHGDVFIAPAIFLKYASDKTFDRDVVKGGALLFDAITLTTGPFLIFKAIEAGRLAIAAYEASQFLISVGNITANSINDPELQSLVDKFNLIVGVWGLSKVVTSGLNFTVSYFTKASQGELHLLPVSTAKEFETSFQNAGTKIEQLAPEVKEKIVKMEEYLKGKVGVVGNITTGSHFSEAFVNSLNGFSDNVSVLAAEKNITLAEFKVLEEKPASLLSNAERGIINGIRNEIPQLDGNTILQKVIPKQDISKYLSGQYTQVRGYMTTAADGKHLDTYEDIFYGMRLDYPGTPFSIADGSCGVIRFKATNAGSAYIPKSSANEGSITDLFPFTGHGFTSGTNGRLGVPEWKMDDWALMKEGSELWEVSSNGVEVLKATYNESLGKFIPVN